MFVSLTLCREDESIQLTAQKISLLFQVLDPFLQPRVLLLRDLQLCPQVGHHHEGVVDRGQASRWSGIWTKIIVLLYITIILHLQEKKAVSHHQSSDHSGCKIPAAQSCSPHRELWFHRHLRFLELKGRRCATRSFLRLTFIQETLVQRIWKAILCRWSEAAWLLEVDAGSFLFPSSISVTKQECLKYWNWQKISISILRALS